MLQSPDSQSARQQLRLEWRDRCRAQLPNYGDWLRGTDEALWCEVLTLQPRLRLPWCYDAQQEAEGDVWECGSVWLHCFAVPNGAVYSANVHRDLEVALDGLHQGPPRAAQYTLLVAPDGMHYDTRRLGGDHQLTAGTTGKRFTLSVRRGPRPGTKVLLAIAWDKP
jgi:hypothetical protein